MAMTPLGGSGDDDAPIMDINTTPLIDVMLVLLVMLIITIPIQLHAVDLRLPVSKTVATAPPPVPVTLRIGADDTLSWNGEPLADRADLQRRMAALAAQPTGVPLRIESDGRASYGALASVMVAADQAGLRRLGVASVPVGP
ncbi:ExbD/TolR family protein [Sphaerotilus mobilis]|uniref:Biopolymer transport protein ExbD n=1 Tax=Sphaerotilus mobilis TaxID=47994 RepID=A0A4Q7LPN0_9BURK|nr:biopolymer transporter ExbD [Sphaerotilus mobilis]RZS56686.1 biopolymer transport protein ExbD [Sphaerotilus mobilis]